MHSCWRRCPSAVPLSPFALTTMIVSASLSLRALIELALPMVAMVAMVSASAGGSEHINSSVGLLVGQRCVLRGRSPEKWRSGAPRGRTSVPRRIYRAAGGGRGRIKLAARLLLASFLGEFPPSSCRPAATSPLQLAQQICLGFWVCPSSSTFLTLG